LKFSSGVCRFALLVRHATRQAPSIFKDSRGLLLCSGRGISHFSLKLRPYQLVTSYSVEQPETIVIFRGLAVCRESLRSLEAPVGFCDGSEPDEIGIDEYRPDEMDTTDVTGLTDCHVTRKGIYIARLPSPS
jgi:hypothetical protein